MNFFTPILNHAQARPDAPALIDGARTITYGELGQVVRIFAGRLASLGVGRGDRVGIADIEFGVGESDDVVLLGDREDGPREGAARAGDDEPHGVRARTASRCSRYQATVAARPSSKAIDGVHPRARRRVSSTP